MKDISQFLFFLTIIQFWWIAIWGLAYMVVEVVAGDSKQIEFILYALMLLITMMILHLNPTMIHKL